MNKNQLIEGVLCQILMKASDACWGAACCVSFLFYIYQFVDKSSNASFIVIEPVLEKLQLKRNFLGSAQFKIMC